MTSIKDQEAILSKLGIEQLNDMQLEVHKQISSNNEVVLLSPTGTGKTLAFLLPIIAELDVNSEQIQVLILVPSRELAIQIEQVVREMGSGFKANAVYGGRAGSKDKIDLKHAPAILIGTPGRIADHLRRENISTDGIKTLVLDEFDKSLQTGFEKEMVEIVDVLHAVKKKILTSATQKVEIPAFVGLNKPILLDYLKTVSIDLEVKVIEAKSKNKYVALVDLLSFIGKGNGIVFCNFKDTIQKVSSHLQDYNIEHACFFGGMEQIDRERSLIGFRNGTNNLLVATDLAARGIDVPGMDFIIHLELPTKIDEYTHRNGRTARMNNDGTAYVIKGLGERLPDFIDAPVVDIEEGNGFATSEWKTVYISGGRKDKISKGDIAGLFFKQGQLDKNQLGTIELKQDCAYVAVAKDMVDITVEKLNNSRLKKKKVRISVLK